MNDKKLTEVIKKNIEEEPYAKLFGIKVLELSEGHSKVTMKVKKDYNNIFGITHGGAVFSLLDVAFGSAANSYGTVAVALNINVNYLKPSLSGDTLTAEAKEVAKSNKISTFNIIVKNGSGEIVAVAQTVAYQKNEKLPFLK
ncbi:MAG: hotdog fold thioesterase [Actinobacteria bacterium]|nr:hotdog fold thioesterase [Actinomycetota bacterium]